MASSALPAILSLLILVSASEVLGFSTPESRTYTAAVVEFSSQPLAGTTEQTVNLATAAYLEFIEAEEGKDADVVVFPESTLNKRDLPFEVPDPETSTVLCGNQSYHKVMQAISCAAKKQRKYVVINITEKKSNDDGSSKLYNTNVVFDRNGAVVSRYRKWNLYGEAGISVTETPDISFFTTDFNVTFGHFICFDIMFATPALDLVQMGISDIIYTTMWFGQLPFLTGVQTQQMWSFKNKVNLLAAGAGNPSVGSTGTGIFSGKYGPLKTLMSPKPTRRMLVAEVLKRQFWDDVEGDAFEIPTNVHSYTAEDMAELFLKRDNMELFNTIPMVAGPEGRIQEYVCQANTCCHFDILVDQLARSENESTVSYQYRLVAFDGHKSNRGTLTCAVVACMADTLDTCGHRFAVGEVIEPAINFQSIVVSTSFAGSRTFAMPNVVDLTVMPISYDELAFQESEPFVIDGTVWRDFNISLLTPHSDLYTFGIFGRDFDRDGQA